MHGMKIELVKWSPAMKRELMAVCNGVDRTFLSNRMPDPCTEEAADWWLGMVSEHDGKDGVFRAVVVDGKVAGNISVERKTDVYCRDAEIGYSLLPEYRSRGIMTEAARRICELAFPELDLVRITGLVYVPNVASQRVLEKNGFVREGVQRNAVFKNGRIWDLCLYGKLKESGAAATDASCPAVYEA